MEFKYVISGVVLFSFFAYGFFRIGKSIWSEFDHARLGKNCTLKKDAKIVDVDTVRVRYLKNGAKYKTTVRFSDGFTFITHETDREDHVLSYRISIDSELYKQIIDNAIEMHDAVMEKQQHPSKFAPKLTLKLYMIQLAVDSQNY